MTCNPSINAKSSSRFSVFDFTEDDELPEQTSQTMISRFRHRKRPKRVASPITKYQFLHCFVGCKGPVDVADKGGLQSKDSAEPIDVDDDPVGTSSGVAGHNGSVDVANKGGYQNKDSAEPIDVDDAPASMCSGVVDGVNALSMDVDVPVGSTGIGGRGPGYCQVPVVTCLPQRDVVAKGRVPLSECTELSSDSENERNEAALTFDDDNQIEVERPLASVSTSTEKEDPSNKQVAAPSSVGQKTKNGEHGSFEHICSDTSQPLTSSLELDGNYREIVYPKDDPDAVLVTTRDLELLQPATFINDTIIDFYVKYLLKTKIRPEDQNRFHFFNSFYFRKLVDLDKDVASVYEGKAAFERVHKWTKKVNLFEKEYIFIPVNYSLHWSLIVICHLSEVALSTDDAKKRSAKVPCILHMNSIQGSHRGLKNVFQSYLMEEWKVRHQDMVDDVASKFLNLSFIQLELPQQANSFDCGLFLLHYLELFLEDAPVHFNPFKLSKVSNFLSKNWFPPDEASLKRIHIQKLVSGVLLHHSEGTPLVDYMKKYPSSKICSNSHEEETELEILQEQSSSPKTCQTYASRPNVELRIGHSPIANSHSAFHEGMGKAGMNIAELSKARTSSGSLYDDTHQLKQTHQSTNLSPIKKQETEEEVCDSFSGTEDNLLGNGESAGTPSSIIREFKSSPEAPRKQKHVQVEELSDNCSSGSQKSSEIGVDEKLDAYAIGDSEDNNSMHENDVVEDSISSIHAGDSGAAPLHDQTNHTTDNNEEVSSKTRKEVHEQLDAIVVEDSEDLNSKHDCEVVEDSISSIHAGGCAAVPLHDQTNRTTDDVEDVSSKIRKEVSPPPPSGETTIDVSEIITVANQ